MTFKEYKYADNEKRRVPATFVCRPYFSPSETDGIPEVKKRGGGTENGRHFVCEKANYYNVTFPL
jgi:hypothetical protein